MEKNMVVSYLEKMHQDLYKHKLNIESQLQKYETLLNNNQKFINTLEKSLDNNLESFSPRQIDKNSHDKIVSLRKEQNFIETETLKLENELKEVKLRLKELQIVLRTERENMKALLEYKNSMKTIKENYREILKIQELERQRTAQQLYHAMIQSYDKMMHKIEVCKRLINVDLMGSHKELTQMAEHINNSMQNMLRIVYDIPFFLVEEMDLEELIRNEIDIFDKKDVKVLFEIEGKKVNLSSEIKFSIVKVVRESFDNIIKYADAKIIRIRMYYKVENLELIIEDDGKGFDTNKIHNENRLGIGISSMKQRVFLFGGNFDVVSLKGKGTRICVEIPLEY